MEDAGIDRLRIVGETAAILERMPESDWARRRYEEAVTQASRQHSVELVAEAAGITPAEVRRIVDGTLELPRDTHPHLSRLLLGRTFRSSAGT